LIKKRSYEKLKVARQNVIPQGNGYNEKEQEELREKHRIEKISQDRKKKS
jgi:hypothetical protein